MLSPPSAHEIRPFGGGRVSGQDREEIGIVDWALNTASIRKLEKPSNLSVGTHNQQSARNDTNRGVFEVIDHDAQGARRGLSERCVAETELLDQERVVTEQGGSVLRTRERRDWVGLGIAAVSGWDDSVRSGMHARCFL